MAKVRVHSAEDVRFRTVREMTQGRPIAGLIETDLDSRVAYHEPGDEKTCQLFEVIFDPHAEVATHCHDEDEIIYVVAGEMLVGARSLKPGSSLFVAGGTFYGFKAGPDGVRFLNFRPRADDSYTRAPQRRPAALG